VITPNKPKLSPLPQPKKFVKFIGICFFIIGSLILGNEFGSLIIGNEWRVIIGGGIFLINLLVFNYVNTNPKANEDERRGINVLNFGLMLLGLEIAIGFIGIGYWVLVNELISGLFFIFIGVVTLSETYRGDELAEESHAKDYQEKFVKYKDQFLKAEPKPTDAQMDSWLQKDLDEIKRDALQKLDINVEDIITPQGFNKQDSQAIVVVGPGPKAQVTIGKDGIIRFSIYDILIVYLTKYHLASYKCTLDLATSIRTQETTQEYAYKNIVSVSTKIGSNLAITIHGQTTSLPNYQQFALSVANGDTISVVTSLSADNQLLAVLKDGKLPDSGADKAIRAIRSQLRDKAID
jgi:hypothetical protein